MSEAQAAFDKLAMPACPQQLSSPVLHSVLSHPEIVPRIFGAKGVGSQGDGCAQMVARSLEDQQALCHFLRAQLKMRPFPLTLGALFRPRPVDMQPLRWCRVMLSSVVMRSHCAASLRG